MAAKKKSAGRQPAKQANAKKGPAKKAPGKKAPAEGAAAKKAAAKKASAKKAAPRKQSAKEAPAANAPRREREKAGSSSPEKNAAMLKEMGKERAHELLRQMLLGRRFEEKTAEAYAIGKIGGFCHLYIGQEAVTMGAYAPLTPDDYVISAYREHVQALAKGVSARAVMAELYGRVDGCSGGRGGSMHLYGKEENFLGGWGIVGGQIPMATGAAFAIKYRGEDKVCLCFMGEAAVNQGAFHESLNMAALWKLPVIYIVENNRFGMGTAWERASSLYDIAQKATAYDMPSAVADGMDLLDMARVVGEAVDRARKDGTPTLIEAQCYRFMGHSMSDPVHGVYRTKEEVEAHKGKDPIRNFIEVLKGADMITDDEIEAMDASVHEEVDDAAEFADASPEPDPATLYDHVYAEVNEHGRLFFDHKNRLAGEG